MPISQRKKSFNRHLGLGQIKYSIILKLKKKMILNEIIYYAVNETTYQAIWPVILLGAGIFLASVIITIIVEDTEPVKGNSIAILGMQGAGKTQLLCNLQNKKYTQYTATIGSEDFKPFELNLGERNVLINAGKDIGGGIENCKIYYERLIDSSDAIFFLFDGQKYLSINDYKKDTMARLDFIYRKKGDKQVVIFATHKDISKSPKRDYQKIKESISDKEYSVLFDKNFIFLNLQEREECIKFLKEKLFSC